MTADIAHELRTPLSVILGHVSALEEGVVPPTSETFEVIREETERLGRLVEDLRTLSRAEAGEIDLRLTPTSPSQILQSAAGAHRPLGTDREIEITLEIEPDLPKLNVDPDRMAQVFNNLMSNALRHSREGGEIRLFVRRGTAGVELGVTDSGPGIDPELLPHIFERFYRKDAARDRDAGGSGLGLAIAKSLVEAQGGRIRAESRPEREMSFLIQLPPSDTSPKEASSL
jgi:signal transduction histidine kinase